MKTLLIEHNFNLVKPSFPCNCKRAQSYKRYVKGATGWILWSPQGKSCLYETRRREHRHLNFRCLREREGVKMPISNMFNLVSKFNVEIIYGVRFHRALWKILTSTWTRTFLVENVWTSWKNLGVGLGLGYTSIISFHISSTHFINGTHRHESTTIHTYINSFRA